MVTTPSTSPPSPPSEAPDARGFDAAASDDAEPADALRGWRRLLRALGHELPAGLAVTNDAARRLSRVR